MFNGVFSYGIICGYYGPIWSEQTFKDYALFCAEYGHRFFIYAPKADAYLREKWREPFDEKHMAFLTRIRSEFKKAGVAFGIGFSPFGLRKLNAEKKKSLIAKFNQVNALSPDILGVFYDDLTPDDISENMGKHQKEIAHFIAGHSNAREFITVPTYYSWDGILTRILGTVPKAYFTQFAGIERRFDVFWTGSHIISRDYTAAELKTVGDLFGRSPFIWDNYPSNDPKYLRGVLRISDMPRQYADAAQEAAGFAFNPMEQGYLSMIPLSAAKQSFIPGGFNARDVYLKNMRRLCGSALAGAIDADLNYFTLAGLDKTESSNLNRMRSVYAGFKTANEKKFTGEILALIDQFLTKHDISETVPTTPPNPFLH